MDLAGFLESGLLELYLLGNLDQEGIATVEKMRSMYDAEITAEINALETFFEEDALKNAIKPSAAFEMKMEKVFASLQTEQQMNVGELPLISPFSSAEAWLTRVAGDLPKDKPTKRFEKLLRNEDGVMQVLVISETDIDEEVHEDVEESFLILKGTCICTIGATSQQMGPGDFMQIPLHLPHTVTLTSTSVTAILQHVQVGN
ncbi:cupin domain-containing protein [Pedobacter yonginense]|nr:cupin domain-containing protein [Pedobacter yonginense]